MRLAGAEIRRREAVCRECPELERRYDGAIVFCGRETHAPPDGQYCELWARQQHCARLLGQLDPCEKWRLPEAAMAPATAGQARDA